MKYTCSPYVRLCQGKERQWDGDGVEEGKKEARGKAMGREGEGFSKYLDDGVFCQGEE